MVRRNRQLSLHRLQRLRRRRIHGGRLEDWLVQAGAGVSAPRQLLRYICWRRGGTRYEVLTNVLAPARLSAEEALDLYPYRWSVERIYFDLKEVLNLNRLYAANPTAVALQVYAAAIVYNALRVAQSDGAAQVGWEPERLSPAKFYPKVATATYMYLNRQQWEREIRFRYRHLHLASSAAGRRWVRAAPKADGGGTPRRGSARPPALEVVRSRPGRPAIYEVILAAMGLRGTMRLAALCDESRGDCAQVCPTPALEIFNAAGSGQVEGQLAQRLAGQPRDGVGERGRQWWQARLAHAGGRFGAEHDMHRDLGHVGNARHDEGAKVALLYLTILQRDRRARQAHSTRWTGRRVEAARTLCGRTPCRAPSAPLITNDERRLT